MKIDFRTRRLAKAFNRESTMNTTFGSRVAKAIMRRMAVLEAAPNLAMVPVMPPERCHQLGGDRNEQFAVDLVHPKRLVFIPNHGPVPRKADGGIDTAQVMEITIIEVVDYH